MVKILQNSTPKSKYGWFIFIASAVTILAVCVTVAYFATLGIGNVVENDKLAEANEYEKKLYTDDNLLYQKCLDPIPIIANGQNYCNEDLKPSNEFKTSRNSMSCIKKGTNDTEYFDNECVSVTQLQNNAKSAGEMVGALSGTAIGLVLLCALSAAALCIQRAFKPHTSKLLQETPTGYRSIGEGL